MQFNSYCSCLTCLIPLSVHVQVHYSYVFMVLSILLQNKPSRFRLPLIKSYRFFVSSCSMSNMEGLAEAMKVLSLMSDEDLDTPEGLAAFAEVYNNFECDEKYEDDDNYEAPPWVLRHSRYLHLVEVLQLEKVDDLTKYSLEEIQTLLDEHHDAYYELCKQVDEQDGEQVDEQNGEQVDEQNGKQVGEQIGKQDSQQVGKHVEQVGKQADRNKTSILMAHIRGEIKSGRKRGSTIELDEDEVSERTELLRKLEQA